MTAAPSSRVLPDPARALVFDFNGTLSDDEPVLYRVYAELFAAHGRPLTELDYAGKLAGLAEEDLIRAWLGDRPDLDLLVRHRIDRYRELVTDGSTISPGMRAAVRAAAARVPVAIVSGAAAEEILPVITAAGLAGEFTTIVAAGDVAHGKPHPEGYQTALARLRARLPDLEPPEVVAFEDTEAGARAARAAGMRTIGVLGTLPPKRLAMCEGLVAGIDRGLIDQLIG